MRHILIAFHAVSRPGNLPPLTVRQIAGLVDLEPSTHLRNLLYDMADSGKLEMRVDEYRGISEIKLWFALSQWSSDLI